MCLGLYPAMAGHTPKQDLLPYPPQDARTNKGYKALGTGVNALFRNNSPFWWTAPGHNNASLCNCNKDVKTSLDAVFPLLKHPPRIYLSHALLFPCTWNDSMEMRTSVYKMKEIYIPFSLSAKFWFSLTAVIPNCCILLWNLFNSLSHLAKHQLIQHNLLQILGICYVLP